MAEARCLDLVTVNYQDEEHAHEEEEHAHEEKEQAHAHEEEEHAHTHEEEEHAHAHEEEEHAHEEEEHAYEEEKHCRIGKQQCLKHPLRHTWTLWFFKTQRRRQWCENNRVVISFGTVEDFWSLYSNIQRADLLPSGCDYSVFKDGIQPMWEDPQNKDGGRWLLKMSKNRRQSNLENTWLEMLLCLIGEAFGEHGDEICGAVVNIRSKGDRLAVWTRDFTKEKPICEIGKILRARLYIDEDCIIGYQAHSDTMSKMGLSVKDRYQV